MKIISPEVRKKISESVKKLWLDPVYRKNTSEKMKENWKDPIYRKKACRGRKGRVTSEETKRKLSVLLKGKKKPPFTKEHRRKLSEAKIGATHVPPSTETRKKISLAQSGSKSRNWKGGITPANKKIRFSIEFRLWREAVFARDNWTCQKCLEKGGRLVPHHIKNFAEWPNLRFAIDNGITFCNDCHILFHKVFGRHNNNSEQIKEFLNRVKN